MTAICESRHPTEDSRNRTTESLQYASKRTVGYYCRVVVQVPATTHKPINDNLTRPVNEPGDSMETDFILATLFNLSVNIVFTLIALAVGVGALRVIDQYLLKSVDIEKELKDNNLAVAIFASTVLIFVALIVSFGLKG